MANILYPATHPKGVGAFGYDGSDFRIIKVDADHHVQTDVLSTSLADDAASETTLAQVQDAIGSRTDPAAGTVNAQLAEVIATVPPVIKTRIYTHNWDTALGAGGNVQIFPTHTGRGYVTDIMFQVDGSSPYAIMSMVRLTLEGTTYVDFILQDGNYLGDAPVGNYSGIDVMVWDSVGDEYWMHWQVHIPFYTSLRAHVVNGDPVNAITFRLRVVYYID